MRWCGSFGLLALAACAHLAASPPPEAPLRLSLINLKIEGYHAADGLEIVFVPDRKAREVSVTMRYRVGAVDDPPGQEGMAHLVEHLAFQKVADGESIFARLEATATQFNGTTESDVTSYVERGTAALLPELLAIEVARLTVPCASITEDVFEREREVVIAEGEQKANAFAILEALTSIVYPEGHPYHRVGQTAASLRSITREQACAFAERHYGPKNAVLVVSGNLDEDTFKSVVPSFVAALPDRDVEAPRTVPPVAARGQRIVRTGPFKHGVIVAWPLPADPKARALAAPMAVVLAAMIDESTDAQEIGVGRFGGDRAPVLLLAIDLGNRSIEETLTRVRTGLARLDSAVAAKIFQHVRQRALYAELGQFEDGANRDNLLAQYVEAGREAGGAYNADVHAVADATYETARQVAQSTFDFTRATIIEIQPSSATADAKIAAVAASNIHEAGQPRLDVDPADAHRPARLAGAPDPLGGAQIRKLANGLTVVLVPTSSVPVVDLRLVFAVGDGDDDPRRRGLAALAGYAYHAGIGEPWWLPFFQAGGALDARVERDLTSYSVRGLGMYIDYLLTGLAHTAEPAPFRQLERFTRMMELSLNAKPVRRDTWSDALFGADHPYAAPKRIGDTVDAAAVSAYRAAHFTPDNATLIVAGGFDPDVANRWIDYLFGSWRGHAAPRSLPRATLHAASIARETAGPQVVLEIALPARGDLASRAAQLVVAEMASELVADVRHQLGASYGVRARLVEERLSTRFEITGTIEAARAAEAVALIRDRLEHLRTGSDQLAGAFVRARDHVIARLGSYASGSQALADRVEDALALGRSPHADAATEGGVRALTLDGLAGTLVEIDLAAAAIRATGPRDAVTAMFAALGRTPVFEK